MKFDEINEDSKVYPGEYLLHEPTMEIVICGAFNWEQDMIRCLSRGKLLEDKVSTFKKIRLTAKENKARKHTKCKGCSSANKGM
jgi:hypothetical protein